MRRRIPTANDVLALFMTIIGLGIGSLCFWAWANGHIGGFGGAAGMVIGAIIALPPLLFWNVDTQKWEVTLHTPPK